MLEWLSDWLRQILAVVLLAAVVDLLMPGKSFHRYTRFVLGLLILLAMLGPVLKLLQGDPEALLKSGMRGWEAASRKEAPKMPGLDEIQRRAKELRDSQYEHAAAMTGRRLESEIETALSRQPGLPKAEVTVSLGGYEEEAGPRVEAVTVQFESAASESRQEDGAQPGDQDAKAIAAVTPIDRIDTTVELNGASAPEDGGHAAGKTVRISREAPPEAAAAVRTLLYQGWGVEPERITVLAPAESS